MKDMLVLVTVNNRKGLYASTADELAAVAPNIQMGLLTAYIKSRNIEVVQIDSEWLKLSIEELIDLVNEYDPLLFGIICTGANPSSSTMTMSGIIDFCKKAAGKLNNEMKCFVWGAHPTVLPERTLRETGVDFVIRGEGFQAIEDLYNTLKCDDDVDKIAGLSYTRKTNGNGKTEYTHNEDAVLVKDLDILPDIDWNSMNPLKYKAHNWHCFGDINGRSPYAVLWTSFGCPYQCSFCSINNLFGKRVQRFRSVDRVIQEISLLVEKFNVKHIKILDELFVVKPSRIEAFCDKLEEKGYDLNMWAYARVDTVNKHLLRRLKKVGMNWISYGFETATPETLKDIHKGATKERAEEVIKMTKEEGLNICADVMFGLWEDDNEAMERTYEFLVRYNFEWANVYPVFAYPGTPLFNGEKTAVNWNTYSLYGYDCEPMGTKYLTPKEVLKFRDEAFVRYHGRPEYLRMIESKFGVETKEHILRMLKVPLKRRLLED